MRIGFRGVLKPSEPHSELIGFALIGILGEKELSAVHTKVPKNYFISVNYKISGTFVMFYLNCDDLGRS